jgi:hypothetical protein
MRSIAEEDAYAALLISMHTYSLLHDHADRSTIAAEQLPLLDTFLEKLKAFQGSLLEQIRLDPHFSAEQTNDAAILDHFRLLQATDNLSLLTCVDFQRPAHLLHPLPLRNGGHASVAVRHVGTRRFVLEPYPFSDGVLTFEFPARFVTGKTFGSSEELQEAFGRALVDVLSVTVSAG